MILNWNNFNQVLCDLVGTKRIEMYIFFWISLYDLHPYSNAIFYLLGLTRLPESLWYMVEVEEKEAFTAWLERGDTQE